MQSCDKKMNASIGGYSTILYLWFTMNNNFRPIFRIIIIVILGVVLIARNYLNKPSSPPSNQPDQPVVHNNQPKPDAPINQNTSIPQKVYDVLAYIRANHHAMDGYVGGRVFTNYEKVVPTEDNNGNAISYQEWDVNPHIQGVNRGTERILTGSDGRAWYTHDHYKTFQEIK